MPVYIPVILEDAGLLAAFVHPSHLELLSSRGFVQLPATRIVNDFGYRISISERAKMP